MFGNGIYIAQVHFGSGEEVGVYHATWLSENGISNNLRMFLEKANKNVFMVLEVYSWS
jgi:hypothetical protein